jgi:hypothetical protein
VRNSLNQDSIHKAYYLNSCYRLTQASTTQSLFLYTARMVQPIIIDSITMTIPSAIVVAFICLVIH